jgi:DMSO/TMAO reductase YedYZ heme-binding membrane subunit
MASRSSKGAAGATTITRDDLESKFRGLQNNIRGAADERKQSVMATGAGIAAVLLVIFFLLGKRSGKKKTTVVEIRRM